MGIEKGSFAVEGMSEALLRKNAGHTNPYCGAVRIRGLGAADYLSFLSGPMLLLFLCESESVCPSLHISVLASALLTCPLPSTSSLTAGHPDFLTPSFLAYWPKVRLALIVGIGGDDEDKANSWRHRPFLSRPQALKCMLGLPHPVGMNQRRHMKEQAI